LCSSAVGRDRADLGAGLNASVFFLLGVVGALVLAAVLIVRRANARARAQRPPEA